MSRQMGAVFSNCLKNAVEQDANDTKRLLNQIIEQNIKLKEEVDYLSRKIEDQNEMIEKQFGKDIARTTKGKCNNAGEMIQSITLSMKFQRMFDEEWRSVMKTLFGSKKELTGIRFLSKILEDCQSFCQTKANEQLMKFVNPFADVKGHNVEKVITSKEDLHDLYKLRWRVGQHEQNKNAVTNLFSAECKAREDFRTVTKEIKEDEEMECLEAYIRSCCDLCWQSAISDPPVLLKFDVSGKHIADVNDKFKKYHYKSQTEEEGVSDTVMQVVWPAVVMKGDEDIDILIDNAKGSVIVYTS